MNVVAAVTTALVLLLVRRPSPRLTVREVVHTPPTDQATLFRLRMPLSGLALIGAWAFLGGWLGAAAGILAALYSWRVLSRVESPAMRRRREVLARDLPLAVHLLGACLVAGAAISSALDDVASAMPGPVGDEFQLVRRRLLLGSDPVEVWASLDGPLSGVGRSMARAARSGSSVRDAVEGLSVELRADTRLRAESLARSIEVRAAAPLGICFLPAFVVLGVVPMVVGIFSSLRLF